MSAAEVSSGIQRKYLRRLREDLVIVAQAAEALVVSSRRVAEGSETRADIAEVLAQVAEVVLQRAEVLQDVAEQDCKLPQVME